MVSIIVPCYNYGRFLAEALESVIAQRYDNWECIIVNDGSSDNTEQIAIKYANADERFIYIQQPNSGHSAARNRGLAMAKGTYIQFLDADDLLERDKLSFQVPLLEESKDIDIIYSDILTFLDSDKERVLMPLNFYKGKQVTGRNEAIIERLVEDNFFLPGCVLMRRKVFERVGNFKASYGYEDWDFFSRAALAGFGFYHDSREGTKLIARTHGNNTSSKRKQMLSSKIEVRRKVMEALNGVSDSKLTFNSTFIDQMVKEHKKRLVEDIANYHVYYGNFAVGVKNVFLHAYYTRKPFSAILNGVRWTYLRLKGTKL